MDCQSWVLGEGGKVPRHTQQLLNTGDLGEGGGDANWAFQAPATPTNCTLESCHEGLRFVLDLSLEVGMGKMPGERFSYLIEYI